MNWWQTGLAVFGLSVLSGLFYRLGGIGKPFKSWMRDWVCPLIALMAWWILSGFHLSHWWAYLVSYGLMGWGLTTYYDELFGYDNYWLHGFVIGLAMFPLFWTGIHWWAILLRAIIMGATIGGWSKIINIDWLEEGGRGVLITATIPILLL
jgi:hypothetical protein